MRKAWLNARHAGVTPGTFVVLLLTSPTSAVTENFPKHSQKSVWIKCLCFAMSAVWYFPHWNDFYFEKLRSCPGWARVMSSKHCTIYIPVFSSGQFSQTDISHLWGHCKHDRGQAAALLSTMISKNNLDQKSIFVDHTYHRCPGGHSFPYMAKLVEPSLTLIPVVAVSFLFSYHYIAGYVREGKRKKGKKPREV